MGGRTVFVGLETAPLPDAELIEFEGVPAGEATALDAPGGAIVIADTASDSVRIAFVPPELLTAALAQSAIDTARAWWWPVRRRGPFRRRSLTAS